MSLTEEQQNIIDAINVDYKTQKFHNGHDCLVTDDKESLCSFTRYKISQYKHLETTVGYKDTQIDYLETTVRYKDTEIDDLKLQLEKMTRKYKSYKQKYRLIKHGNTPPEYEDFPSDSPPEYSE